MSRHEWHDKNIILINSSQHKSKVKKANQNTSLKSILSYLFLQNKNMFVFIQVFNIIGPFSKMIWDPCDISEWKR